MTARTTYTTDAIRIFQHFNGPIYRCTRNITGGCKIGNRALWIVPKNLDDVKIHLIHLTIHLIHLMIHLTNLIIPLLDSWTGKYGVDEAVIFVDLRGGDAGLLTGFDDETYAAPPHLNDLAKVEHLGDGWVRGVEAMPGNAPWTATSGLKFPGLEISTRSS